MTMLICAWRECAKPFEPTRASHKFCSYKCRMGHAGDRRKEGMKLLAAALKSAVEPSPLSSTGATT